MFMIRNHALRSFSRLSNRYIHANARLLMPIKVGMPSLSPTMETGTIVEWHKKEGETISPGDLLCEIQTDKAVVGMETDDDGILAKIIKAAGSTTNVGELIAVLANTDEDWEAVALNAATLVASEPTASVTSTPPTIAPTNQTPPSQVDSESLGKDLPIGPAVRVLLTAYGLSAEQVTSTGPRGQLLKGDVLAYISSKGLQKVPKITEAPVILPHVTQPTSCSFTDIPVTTMRATIAKRLLESKLSIPHTYTKMVVCVDNLFALQKSINKRAPIKISVNDLIIKACAYGLRLVPDVNSVSDALGSSLVRLQNIDICVAVSTPTGLITPIIQSADAQSISSISAKIRDLAGRARESKLKPNEFTGGSFTISNLGMFGIREFCAIINPPQVAILAVGGGQQSMILDSDSPNNLKKTTTMTLTLATDARFVDELAAGKFLSHVKRYLESDPEFLFADDSQLAVYAGAVDLSTMAV